MHIILGLDVVGADLLRHKLQQVTPDIHFTCDGLITKWIVGAQFDSNEPLAFPEVQV